MDVESVSGTTTHCLQKSANLETFLGLEVRFGKDTLLLYLFVNARRSCISSFMVISLFNFHRALALQGPLRASAGLFHPATKIAESSVQFAFGAAVGALYGALAEYWLDATAGQGAAFALVLLGATHESALPALHLAAPSRRQSKREQLSELVTHLVFGVTAEQLRRRIRAWM